MTTIPELSARYEQIPTGTLFDVLEAHHGLGDTCVLDLGIRPLTPGRSLAGPVHTLRWVRDPRRPEDMPRAAEDRPPISPLFRGMQEGAVILVDGAGDRVTGHWGEMMSIMSMRFGARGVVIDGGARDTKGIAALEGYTTYMRYASPIESISRLRIRDVGAPIVMQGAQGPVRIFPGDWLCCDDDAVIAVPGALVEKVIGECEALEEIEQASRAAMFTDDVDEVFRRFRRG